jgi:hypothetical protein
MARRFFRDKAFSHPFFVCAESQKSRVVFDNGKMMRRGLE